MNSKLEGIAIIGFSGRFPGASNVEEFWNNLLAGRETISFFDDNQLAASGVDLSEVRKRDDYVPARGVLKDIEYFDAAFFRIQPKEAEMTDPQHRVFLEGAWEALEHAGYAPNQVDCSVGVFTAASQNTYLQNVLAPRSDLIDMMGSLQTGIGNEKDYLATRVAYKLNLKGPAINVDTACSGSLVAVCLACQALLTYQCDMALAGGVSIKVPQQRGYTYQAGSIYSPDGHTRAFDSEAAGTTFSNGMGIVVLKRLAEAVRDGDVVYAVIKGNAVNNDGSQRASFAAPGVQGQSEAVALAHANAGFEPETVSYIEAHGTATSLGDAVEIAGLTKTFRAGTDARHYCAIGSVKTNLGHLDAAAGVAGLIKTALALKYGKLPASLHFRKPNPKLCLEDSPFYVNTELMEWKSRDHTPRRAGVSSFGTGGTNAHVALEEAPDSVPSTPSRRRQLLLLSARSAAQLDQVTTDLQAYLSAHSDLDLADVAFTLQTGRTHFDQRRIIVCSDRNEAIAALGSASSKETFKHSTELGEPPVAFLFPGQGSQYVNMGADLYQHEPVFRETIDWATETLVRESGINLKQVLYPDADLQTEAEEILLQTSTAQPALFAVEYGLSKLWMSWGIQPAAMIGHSVGEYVAGCLSGVFSPEEALLLVAERGCLAQSQPPGAMLAIRMSEQEISPFIKGSISLAAVNSPRLCVVSGPLGEIELLKSLLDREGVSWQQLHTSHAFHSAMMDPVVSELRQHLTRVRLHKPRIPYVSTATGRWIAAAEAQDPEYWARHLRRTVRFAEGLEQLCKGGPYILLEVGPGQTLTNLVRQNSAKTEAQTAISSLPRRGEDEFRGILEALGKLWASGVTIDWKGFHNGAQRKRVPLPTYPFAKTYCWPTSVNEAQHPTISSTRSAQDMPTLPEATQRGTAREAATTRKDHLLSIVLEILSELSGKGLADVDPDVTLLELGFDSLMLTQASQLLQRKFRVPITFRQLMGDLSTADALAAALDNQLPAGQWEPPAVALPTLPQPGRPVQHQAASLDLEELLHEQLRVTSQLLDWVKTRGEEPRSAGAPYEPVSPAGQSTTPQVRAECSHYRGAEPSTLTLQKPLAGSNMPKSDQQPHGPFRPIETTAQESLTPTQHNNLQEFIEGYTRRTPRSKRFAQSNRRQLADPRAVAGFKQLWKEMVYPIVVERSEGSRVWDIDGNEYIDFVMGFGASLFGHRPPFVVKAVEEQLRKGFEIGPMTELAAEVAGLISAFTGLERVSFCNTGSEAVMAAIRLARTVTGRDRIALFAGSYHGIFDEVLVRGLNGSNQGRSVPIAPGILQSMVGNVTVLNYGDPESLKVLEREGSELACVLVEPVQSRRLDLQPQEFLGDLRTVTHKTGTALVFDEIVTGFRVHPRGAQELFGVEADLATYGKVLGGGLPIGVVAGRSRFMDALDGGMWDYGDHSFPEVGVTFFAGTFVRHPLALAAARAVLLHLKEIGPQLQINLNARVDQLANRLRSCLSDRQVPLSLTHFSSLMGLTLPADLKTAGLLFYHLREKGIHIWENRNFVVTTAHSDEDLNQLVTAFDQALDAMQSQGFLPKKAVEANPGLFENASAPQEQNVKFVPKVTSLPLTPAQRELWITALVADDASRALNNLLVIRMQGEVNLSLLKRTVQALVDRHDSLRTAFGTNEPIQHIYSNQLLDIPIVDWQTKTPEEQQQQLAAELGREREHLFDLTRPPLLRACVIQMAADQTLLLLNFHHLVSDGWSIGVALDELKQLYNGGSAGKRVSLNPALQFAEYLKHRDSSLFKRLERDAMRYWLGQYEVVPSPVELPADRSRPAIKTYRAARETRLFEDDFFRAIKRTSSSLGSTTLAFLLASFKVLLFRLTSQEDLVVGVPAAGQIAPDLQESEGGRYLLGHCVNFLPIRSQCLGEESFAKYLQKLQGITLDAYEHQAFTFGSLVEELGIPRDDSRFPIVSVIFNLDQANTDFELFHLRTEVETIARDFVVFDLEINVIDSGKAIRVESTYNRDLFDPTTLRRWLGHWQSLLRGILQDPEQTIACIPMMEDYERRQLLADWNETRTPYPKDKLVNELFELQVLQTPDKVAVEYEGKQVSYQALNQRANQIARQLWTQAVGAGDLVGLCVERSIDMVAAVLGVLKSGAAFVPLDPSHPPARLRFVLEDAGIKTVLGHSKAMEALPAAHFSQICLDVARGGIETLGRDNLRVVRDRPTVSHIIYTSGSTGRPKGVEIPHRAVVNLLSGMVTFTGIAGEDVLLAITTLSFDIAGLELLLPLIVGGKVVVAKHNTVTDGRQLADLLETSGATMMQATPATWRLLLESGWKGKRDLKILSGGEELPLPLARQLLERVATLWNLYGPTETTIYSTGGEVTREDDIITIGRPLLNTQTHILDPHLQPVPIGVAGELYIGGEGLANGYRGRPDLTRERFVKNPFSEFSGTRLYRTGDLARYRPDGRIEFLGRMDRQVKIRGFRIELGEIEAVLTEHPQVVQAVVVAREDEKSEKYLVAYVKTGEANVSTGELRKFLKGRLPGYMIPSVFVPLNELPVNSNGKIDRKTLPEPVQTEPDCDRDYRPPRDRLELQLTKIWESLLKRERVGLGDNFFELGGHSLLAVRLLTQINQAMRRNLPLASVFQAPTIEQMASLIRQEGWTPTGQSLVTVQPNGSRPPFFCVHGYAGYHGLAAHLGPDQPFYGLIQGLDGKKFYTRVEDLAAHYLKDVRLVCPKGPYFLGGHSFGGLVAFEMARQLQSQGHQVGLLVLMDSTAPRQANQSVDRQERSMHTDSRVSDLVRVWRQFASLPTADRKAHLADRTRRVQLSLSKDLKRFVCEGYLKLGYSLPPGLRTFYIDRILFGRYYVVAGQKYQARPCDLPAILIEAETESSTIWQKLIPHGLLIRKMPAKHMDMLREPHVGILAHHLGECLERVFQAGSAATA